MKKIIVYFNMSGRPVTQTEDAYCDEMKAKVLAVFSDCEVLVIPVYGSQKTEVVTLPE